MVVWVTYDVRILKALSEAISDGSALDELLPRVAKTFSNLSGASGVRIALRRSSEDVVVYDLKVPRQGHKRVDPGSLLCNALEDGHTCFADEDASNLAIPIRFGVAILGAIELSGLPESSAQQVVLLESAALQLAARLDRDATLEDSTRLAKLAFTDALTEIPNRRAFDEALVRLWSTCAREETPLSIVMIDVDYFKLFNDTYGHQAGDACLKAIAAVLRRCTLRPGDLAARYGGEEFVAVLANTPVGGAIDLAERVRENVNEIRVAHAGSSLGYVSISAGVAVCSPRGDLAPESLLLAADDALYRAKLGGRNRVAGPAYESQTSSAQPAAVPTHNHLPIRVSPLIGRKQELAKLISLFERDRLVTAVGVGGSGKTRIAVEAAWETADRFSDGAHFADLAATRDAVTIAPVVATLLGIRIPQDAQPAVSLARAIGEREMLLILDNCEHLIEAVAADVSSLLASCIHLRILATSREPLGIAGEVLYNVPLLALPPTNEVSARKSIAYDAIDLFVERAKAARRDFVLTDANAPLVAQICRALDGIPLAIELVAARLGIASLDDLAQRVRERVALGAKPDNTPSRQQTMEAAIAWSYDLLRADERTLFRRLAIFAGGFTSESAHMVCSSDEITAKDFFEVLAGLVRKSMVTSAPFGRYRLLVPIREYALAKLLESGEARMMSQRHASAFAQIAWHARARRLSTRPAEWSAQLAADLDNLRAAIDWSLVAGNDPECGVGIVGDIAHVWERHGMTEGMNYVQCALAYTEDDARIWLTLAWMHDYFGTLPHRQVEAATRAFLLFGSVGDRAGCLEALLQRAQAFGSMREHDNALLDLQRAGDLLLELPEPHFEYLVRYAAARAALQREDFQAASSELCNVISKERARGNDHHVALALRVLGEAEFALGNVSRAIECVRESDALRLTIGQRTVMNANLTGYLAVLGELDEARRVGRDTLKHAMQREMILARALTIQHLALVRALEGAIPVAAQLAGHVNAAVEKLQYQREYTERFTYERLLRLLREHLDESELSRLLHHGARLADDEAVTEALKV